MKHFLAKCSQIMDACPFPEFIASATSAVSLILAVFELIEDEDDILPPYPVDNAVFALVMLLRVISDDCFIPLRLAIRRIFPTLRIQREEYWSQIISNPVMLWELTGETPSSLRHIVQRISPEVQRFIRNSRNPRYRIRQTRPFALSIRDRILMCFVWLRTYPTFADLGSRFEVSVSTSAENVHVILMITLVHYENRYITWHSIQSWNSLRGSFDDFPDVVGLLDATPIRINRPQGNIQRMYYRRDRGFHFMNWQVIVDCHGFFTHGQAGFLGHLLDAESYAMMPNIGHNCPLSLPRNSYLLADSGYPTGYPLLIPFSRRGGRRLTANMIMFNEVLSSYRVRVEHRIHDLKIYMCVSGRFRHRRWRISMVANLVMALTNRRRRIISGIRRAARRI